MCECYKTNCCKCKKEIEMHLGDYETRRSELVLFCSDCFPEELSNGIVWSYADKEINMDYVFIKWLTTNAQTYADANHPNYLFVKKLMEV